ncbi:hypothetical protein AVEN_198871-1 [Araneus ventricosus]|uniref:Uncharacterized protein n=1 Tax=Araneus ventricosus TaxID=182803 RepID=A0A4Y2VIP8_ARAVE|nr:hypothetical protein AVEN_198871-1 [Araneus ventricosus]
MVVEILECHYLTGELTPGGICESAPYRDGGHITCPFPRRKVCIPVITRYVHTLYCIIKYAHLVARKASKLEGQGLKTRFHGRSGVNTGHVKSIEDQTSLPLSGAEVWRGILAPMSS